MVQGRLLRCAPEHLRPANVKVCDSTETWETWGKLERSQTLFRIKSSRRVTHIDLRSQSDPPEGPEPRHLSGKIFLRTPTGVSETSSSGMRTATKPVVETAAISSDTTMENLTSATHDTSDLKPATETDETHDKESPDMETDDSDTKTPVPESSATAQSFSPSQLPRHRIHSKRESAVEHERSVKPRIELPDEDELFVSSQLQSFREQVQKHVNGHGVEGIWPTLFSRAPRTVNTPKPHLRMTVTCIVFPRSKVSNPHLMCLGTIWKSIKLQRFARVERSLRQLDQENTKEFDVAKSAEIQSWLRCEAVTAALRSQHHHRDIMKMRWVLRYKESGKRKARLVHWLP